jgi:threonine aldolase
VLDLRSDTVTRPTPAMLAAMAEAPLGDDVLGDDPTVAALEARTAALLGFEASLFTPSGTMANQLAIRTACEAGDEIIAHRDSHIIHYETAAPAAISGCLVQAIEGEGGVFSGEAVAAAIRPCDQHAPRSRMLVVENTVNRAGGTVWPRESFASVAASARRAGLHLHVDGARLLNACVAAGYEPREFLGEGADSCSLCFSKGLGAPVGSALAGSGAFIARARRFRKMLGGAMRQSGLLAAAALHALDRHVERLVEDHALALEIAARLGEIDGLAVEPPPGGLRTNMVFLRLPAGCDAAAFCSGLAAEGVRMIPMGTGRVRAVTHLDLPADAAPQVAAAVRRALAGIARG